jgi:diguanylate cyclase (GGDEF)-like protein
MAAAVLTGFSALIVLYLCLALKEPVLFLQVMTYGMLYLCLAVFLYEMQKRLNDYQLRRERVQEEITLTQQEWIKKQELERALERRIDRFLDLHQFAETLKGVPTVPQLAHRVVQEAHVLVPRAEECVLYLVDEKNEKLSWTASSHPKKTSEKGQGSVYDQWVMRRSRPLIIEDSVSDFRFSTETRGELGGLRSVCACPLMTENKVLGVLRASAADADVFTSDDLHALDIISGLAAVTLKNRLLYDKTEELAIRDGLTGLYLNRYFRERLAEEVKRTDPRSGKFSIIMIDIDNFKRYNDEYGHSAGDLVLKNVASILMRCLEPAEFAARYGGEEFVLILPNKGKKDAMAAAERMRAEIESHKFVLRRQTGTVTASFGVAAFPSDAKNADDLLSIADEKLYEAKKKGRNRVCGSI